jgi:hypothetical protein
MMQVSDLGNQTIAMMFESPLHAKKTIVVLTAAESDRLWHGVRHLIQPEFWGRLQGDLVVWQDTPSSLTWQKAGRDYHVGEVATSTRLEYHFSQYPWLWLSTILLGIGLFTFLTAYLLRRFKRKHHPTV